MAVFVVTNACAKWKLFENVCDANRTWSAQAAECAIAKHLATEQRQ